MEDYLKAGRILRRILGWAGRKITKDADISVLVDKMEHMAFELGGKPAFPVNVSFNHEAAHNTPAPGETVFAEGLIKIDFGVHVNGKIVDAAFTVDLTGEWGKLVEAAEEALDAALCTIKAGIDVRKVGEAISTVAKKYGFSPISNLGGHQIDVYRLHAGIFIPNIPRGNEKIPEGAILAIEPFITNGKGFVVEGDRVEIFSCPTIGRLERDAMLFLRELRGLPFARRWVYRRFGATRGRNILEKLKSRGVLKEYPVLLEVTGGCVAQAETTIIVEKDGPIVLV